MNLIEAIKATAELCGTELSQPAAQMIVSDLMEYPERLVQDALKRCRTELKGRLTLESIISRIDDGRPGPDEAWASLCWNDRDTCVLTIEAEKAQFAVRPTYTSGDKSASRYAFVEVYKQLVSESRSNKQPVQWIVSLGWDITGRDAPIESARQLGRISSPNTKRIEGGKSDEVPMPIAIRSKLGKLIASK